MKLARSAALYGYKVAFNSGIESAGRALLAALDDDEEDIRTLAAMFLVQSGRRAIPLLREQLAKGHHVPEVLTMLGDIADPATVPDIERYVASADAEVARAAREALEILRRNR